MVSGMFWKKGEQYWYWSDNHESLLTKIQDMIWSHLTYNNLDHQIELILRLASATQDYLPLLVQRYICIRLIVHVQYAPDISRSLFSK